MLPHNGTLPVLCKLAYSCNHLAVTVQPAYDAPVGREADSLRRGLGALADLVPADWKISQKPARRGAAVRPDAIVAVEDSRGAVGRVIIEAWKRLVPRDVATFVGGKLPSLRGLDADASVLVVAPWLSQRTRDLLAEQGVAYLDLTGNVLLRLDRPALFIRTTGAAQDPNPALRGGLSLRGTAAGRVVRLLADVRPPYTASAIAGATAVSVPYVSRLLTALDKEALVQRGARGLVIDVDWANLLRRRAETYDVFGTNLAQGFVSRTGTREVVGRLRERPDVYRAVTGSFAASELAPVAAPAQLAVYVDDARRTAEALELLPADVGADVVLLAPYDFVVLDRAMPLGGLMAVSPSQLALDCLTGNGRMPAEGEALLEWMRRVEDEWRVPHITRGETQ
jgi:hypothetical protein